MKYPTKVDELNCHVMKEPPLLLLFMSVNTSLWLSALMIFTHTCTPSRIPQDTSCNTFSFPGLFFFVVIKRKQHVNILFIILCYISQDLQKCKRIFPSSQYMFVNVCWSTEFSLLSVLTIKWTWLIDFSWAWNFVIQDKSSTTHHVSIYGTPFGPSTDMHARTHTHTFLAKCLNRSLCECTMCAAAAAAAAVSSIIWQHWTWLYKRGGRSKPVTGSSLGCGGWRGAPLCEVPGQTAS